MKTLLIVALSVFVIAIALWFLINTYLMVEGLATLGWFFSFIIVEGGSLAWLNQNGR